ncbi:AraC family transcriptional regulator, activator of mtrCDE [Amycolatopsis pretoriensis]|uniref:AraC family transcriptional regulator, activator of mtrCDE n=1 Tax=Amycolatopsis pretoriensis TaxID=218821 RepID=A0A1H5RDD6_9PSEU|nr:AraC family transcriptional regulator [Amycolatopsis pretoriensis]SEF36365.1 AraC family transcriptional regulator, activator of mtrCDE [Amycolatopsis pretoriensis]
MDTISRLLRMAQLGATLEKHCLLGAATRMDIARYGELEVPFHVLLDGECRLYVGREVFELRSGDVVLIPSGAAHRVVTAGPGRPRGIVETDGDAFATTRSERGGDPVIDLFCGHYTVNAGAGALLFRSLPGAIHVAFGQSAETDEVLRALSSLMRLEASREGSGTAAILAALCTVLLAMVLRTARGADVVWTAVTDPGIADAVGSVLAEPGQDWTIERLGRQASMSRATFLRRFVRETGMTVGAFLARARVMAAAELLTTTDAPVATVADRVGYRSESAFGRAFRAEVGTTPGRFRREAVLRRASAAA